jgi:hypothetical protein
MAVALTPPIEPMLAESRTTRPREQELPGGLAYEQKLWTGLALVRCPLLNVHEGLPDRNL